VGALVVGLAATKAPWAGALRAYVRDHSQALRLHVVMDRADLSRALPGLDVLVVDDVMRTFSAGDIARARGSGLTVFGVHDPGAGMGVGYLSALGVDHQVEAGTPAVQLAAALAGARARPRPTAREVPEPGAGRGANGPRRRARAGTVLAWTKVSGGAGLTEAVIAAAEHLGGYGRTLLVEADELAPVLAPRLSRDTEAGLPYALARAAQGLRCLPEGLSAAREEGATGPVSFEVSCNSPGPARALNPAHLERVIDQAASQYEYVLVETGWLPCPSPPRGRASACRSALQAAGAIVVVASADPEGAARLLHWRAALVAEEVGAPCWAVFGRARKDRYQRSHLVDLVAANAGRHPFAGYSFLPEDPDVARARWNGDLVKRGPWLAAVRQLAGLAAESGTRGREPAPVDARALAAAW
jgi:Mrp family chromosome partitioning ATPase